MVNDDFSWDLYCFFFVVMCEGSLFVVVCVLGMIQFSLGWYICVLEQQFGVVLFICLLQGLMFIEMVYELLLYVQVMVLVFVVMCCVVSVGIGELCGVVCVSVSEVIGGEVLFGMLVVFWEQYLGVVIELVLFNQFVDLLCKDVDLVVCMVQFIQQVLVVCKVGIIVLNFYVYWCYFKVYGMLQWFDQLVDYVLIGFDYELFYVCILCLVDLFFICEYFVLCIDSDLVGLVVLCVGFGIGFCQVLLVVCDCQFVLVLVEVIVLVLFIWLVMYEDLCCSVCYCVLFDFLVEVMVCYVVGESLGQCIC